MLCNLKPFKDSRIQGETLKYRLLIIRYSAKVECTSILPSYKTFASLLLLTQF